MRITNHERNIAVLLFSLLLICEVLQAQRKTIRDEVKEKGAFTQTIWDDLPRTEPHTFDQLIRRSDLIVRGQVVNESARLSEDESTVLTDYEVEVETVLKDDRNTVRAGDRVTVSKYGGAVTVEGHPVTVTSTTFPPIPWRTTAVFFVVRAQKPNGFWNSTFSLNEFGVWVFRDDELKCDTERRRKTGYSSPFCGKSLATVEDSIRKCISKLRGGQK